MVQRTAVRCGALSQTLNYSHGKCCQLVNLGDIRLDECGFGFRECIRDARV